MPPECDYCGEPVRPGTLGVSEKCVGWVTPRKEGGAHHLRLSKPMHEYIHNHCLRLLETGINKDQGSLL